MKAIIFLIFLCQMNMCIAQQASPGASIFRSNPQLTGVYNTSSAYHINEIQFTFKTEGPIRTAPALSGDAIYLGSGDGSVYAIDKQTGSRRWQFHTQGPVHSSPAVSRGLVYFSSRDKFVYAVNEKTGKEKWKFEMGEDLPYTNGWDFFLSSPNVTGDRLYIGGGDGYLYALNSTNGKLLWKFNAGARIRTTPAVAGNAVIFGAMNGYVYSLALETGTVQWKFATDGSNLNFADAGYDRTGILCSPAVKDGVVAIGGRDGFLYILEQQTGNLRHKISHNGSWVLNTAIDSGIVYTANGTASLVQAFDIATGKEKWRYRAYFMIFSALAVTGDMLYFGDRRGIMYGLNKANGKLQWRFPAGTRVFASPVIDRGIVYCGSDDGYLYALSGSTTRSYDTLVQRQKAVYWEPAKSRTAYRWFSYEGDVWIKEYLRNFGYIPVNDTTIKTFLEQQLNQREPGMIVFANNQIPKSVLEGDRSSMIRKFLDAGGKVVLLGANPSGLMLNDTTGRLEGFNFEKKLNDVFSISTTDNGNISADASYVSYPTPEGRKLGLRDFWLGYSSVEPSQVDKVYAENEYGRATMWLKSYGGRPGTGLLQLTMPKEVIGTQFFLLRMIMEKGFDW